MAKMQVEGLDDLMLDMKAIAELPDSVANEMLQASGKIVAEAQARKIRESVKPDTSGVLAKSVKVSRMKKRKGSIERFVTVYPKGTHHVNANGKKVTNNEVFFINEFGAPKRHINAKGIAKAANAESADAANAAEAQIYDKFLKSKNL